MNIVFICGLALIGFSYAGLMYALRQGDDIYGEYIDSK